VNLTSSVEQRSEETKALNVVGMQMREQDVNPRRSTEGGAQPSDPSASIENQRRTVRRPNLNAGSVPAVSNGFRAGTG
jgi:hypothetical protein